MNKEQVKRQQVQRKTENSDVGRNKTSFRSRGSNNKKTNNFSKNNNSNK